MAQLEIVRACEERLVNVWPSVSTMLMDGWVVRFANGYTSRANSASPVMQGAMMTPTLLDEIEKLYRAAGLKPAVRVTPVCGPGVEALLMERGYRIKDRSLIMTLDLAAYRSRAPDERVSLEHRASRTWVEQVGRYQSVEKRNPDHLYAIVGAIRVSAAFATLLVDSAPAGFAMCAIDRGYAEVGSVIVDAAHRGKGLGRVTVDSLLTWAAGQGASTAFLQVDSSNEVAVRLYESQGFTSVGRYLNTVLD